MTSITACAYKHVALLDLANSVVVNRCASFPRQLGRSTPVKALVAENVAKSDYQIIWQDANSPSTDKQYNGRVSPTRIKV